MSKTFHQIYANKKVLVTGHTGFKGAWLSLWLQSLGAEVTGYALDPPTEPNLYTEAKLQDLIHSHQGDIRDFESFNKVIQELKPDFIFHLAAQSIVRVSYEMPIETFETNVLGTMNLLESLSRNPFRTNVIIVTSDKCYHNDGRETGYEESDALGGRDPYSSSKACAELSAGYYEQRFDGTDVRVARARAGNVIGGGDWAKDRILPDSARAFSQNEKVGVRNPQHVRPWQHVLEPLSGYLLLARKLAEDNKYSGAWNFGPEDEDMVAVQQILDLAVQAWPGSGYEDAASPDAVHEAGLLKLSCKKTCAQLNWQPHWHLKEAVQKSMEWYQAYYQDSTQARALCLSQIEDYSQ